MLFEDVLHGGDCGSSNYARFEGKGNVATSIIT